MIHLIIDVEDAALRAVLGRAVAALRDTTPAMRELAGTMKAASDRAFAGEADPATGGKWAPLSPRWRARRNKMRYDGPILQMKGRLKGSISQESGKDFARVGTNVEYAAAHQFGAVIRREAGQMTLAFRKVGTRSLFAGKRHKKKTLRTVARRAYSIRIPARPFLGVGQEDVRVMLTTLARSVIGIA